MIQPIIIYCETVVQKMHTIYNINMPTAQNITQFLASLGFDKDSCKIYTSLWNNGAQTISELSRTSNVERTKIYRLLPKLQQSNLVEIDKEYSREIIRPASPDVLQELISTRQEQIQAAQRSLPELVSQRADNQSGASRVNVYRGASGVKQLLWNETKATTEVLCLLQEPMQSTAGKLFFERWVAKCNEKNLIMRGVVGEAFMQSRDRWYDTHVNESLANWDGRVIDAAVFNIDHNVVIYDDTVAYFSWNPKNTFGVELHDPTIAATQRQFFELLWNTAGAK